MAKSKIIGFLNKLLKPPVKAIGGLVITTLAVTPFCLDTVWGPVRALILLSKPVKNHEDSIRKSDVKWIKERITGEQDIGDGGFAVVCGESGMGKTRAVQCATNGLQGIISIECNRSDAALKEKVMNEICDKIVGLSDGWRMNEAAMKHTIKWYSIFSGHVPVVIISAAVEQYPYRDRRIQAHELTSTASTLRDTFGLKVLIDAEEDSVSDFRTGREDVLEIKPLCNEMMRSLPDYRSLSPTLKSQGNEEVVLAVCSGSPQILNSIHCKVKECETEERKDTVVHNYIEEQIQKLSNRVRNIVNDCPKMQEVGFITLK
jgi:hypothetical protein